jgi:cytochrome c oxidase subunit 1
MSTTADSLHLRPHEAHDAHHDADHKPGFFVRWFMSTNHKDIGTLYLIFAIIAGIIGGGISGIMRWELMEPGIQVLNRAWPIGAGTANFDEWAHHWNVLITAHGLIMVFFMVMPGARMLKMVVMKLIAPRIELAPARWREKIAMSTTGPADPDVERGA